MRLLNFVLTIALSIFALPSAAESLFNSESFVPLLTEHQSLKVGDLITVLIYESSQASQSSGTTTAVENSVGLQATDGFTDIAGSIGASGNYDGSGKTVRSEEIKASVSVQIANIRANGDLEIAGSQMIRLNSESRIINISGVIRPEDVSPNNTVASARIGESVIEFYGDGVLTSAEKPGMLTRVWNWIF